MRYLSVCSGIEAATVAWHPLGWEPAAFSEIEKFPRLVLQYHYPHVPLHGDFTTIKGDEYGPIDLIVGGTPCQSFSIAGLREGLADPRGNLMLEYCALAKRICARWLVWENVPGVLSSNRGRDFGTFLGSLAECGYGFAYRVLDAQYFGVAQRRRRVFVVACLGDWRSAAAVLFERHSLQGHPAPRREAGKAVAGTFKACARSGGWSNSVDHAAAGYMQVVPDLANPLTARMHKGINTTCDEGQTMIAFSSKDYGADAIENLSPPIIAQQDSFRSGHMAVAIGFNGDQSEKTRSMGEREEQSPTIRADGPAHVAYNTMQVRRLTPTECERLQGFPDGYTDIRPKGKATADGPRYKALGNSMAVPVMHWIGKRIQMVEEIRK